MCTHTHSQFCKTSTHVYDGCTCICNYILCLQPTICRIDISIFDQIFQNFSNLAKNGQKPAKMKMVVSNFKIDDYFRQKNKMSINTDESVELETLSACIDQNMQLD